MIHNKDHLKTHHTYLSSIFDAHGKYTAVGFIPIYLSFLKYNNLGCYKYVEISHVIGSLATNYELNITIKIFLNYKQDKFGHAQNLTDKPTQLFCFLLQGFL